MDNSRTQRSPFPLLVLLSLVSVTAGYHFLFPSLVERFPVFLKKEVLIYSGMTAVLVMTLASYCLLARHYSGRSWPLILGLGSASAYGLLCSAVPGMHLLGIAAVLLAGYCGVTTGLRATLVLRLTVALVMTAAVGYFLDDYFNGKYFYTFVCDSDSFTPFPDAASMSRYVYIFMWPHIMSFVVLVIAFLTLPYGAVRYTPTLLNKVVVVSFNIALLAYLVFAAAGALSARPDPVFTPVAYQLSGFVRMQLAFIVLISMNRIIVPLPKVPNQAL